VNEPRVLLYREDYVEELKAEVEHLTAALAKAEAERDEWRGCYHEANGSWVKTLAALEAAEARLDLCLRALHAVEGSIDFLPRTEDVERREDEALALVRAALAGGGTERAEGVTDRG
jgi:hypothetical protein